IRHKVSSPKGFLDVDPAPAYPTPAHMEEAGRIQRYQLLAQACRDHQLQALLTGHHLGDLVETTFFRFWRESGVDGMAGIPALATILTTYFCQQPGLLVARPLLLFPKPRLRATCKAHGLPWSEDPSNHTPAFQRNIIRAEIQHASMGSYESTATTSATTVDCSATSHPNPFQSSPLTMEALYQLSRRMQMRRYHVESLVQQFLRRHAQFDSILGIAALDIPFTGCARSEPTEWVNQDAILSRAMVQILQWVSGDEQRPRTKKLLPLLLRIRAESEARQDGKLFHRAVPGHTKRWVFYRQPFYAHEKASTLLPIPRTLALDVDKPRWVCWTTRFFCAAIFSNRSGATARAPETTEFYVRALHQDDIPHIRKNLPTWQSTKKEKNLRLVLARMQCVPVHVRHTLPIIVAKFQGQEVPVYVHALGLKRIHPATRHVEFRVMFARRNPAQFSDWRFVALDPKLLSAEDSN
ncbi:hypothetical protein H4R34_004737, partial [Dimargaris verticillata]